MSVSVFQNIALSVQFSVHRPITSARHARMANCGKAAGYLTLYTD